MLIASTCWLPMENIRIMGGALTVDGGGLRLLRFGEQSENGGKF